MQKFAIAYNYKMSTLRLTSARKAILEFLEETGDHYTSNQIYSNLTKRLPSLNRTTVYRSLEYLVSHNLISVSDIGTGSQVYQRVQETPHHHLVCLNCNHIIKIEHQLVAPFFRKLEQELDYKIKTNHLVLYGTCKNCQ